MGNWKDVLKEAEEKLTPIEVINEIIDCISSLYSGKVSEGVTKLPKELSEYAGYIGVILNQAELLKTKLTYKPSGIIRRIDDIGRVVIPKDIRKIMGINEGDPLELTMRNGELSIVKYLREDE